MFHNNESNQVIDLNINFLFIYLVLGGGVIKKIY
jgi:hypothetical protein